MKCFSGEKYEYIGQHKFAGKMWHAFKDTDPRHKKGGEIVFVEEAKMVWKDGRKQYFDKIEETT